MKTKLGFLFAVLVIGCSSSGEKNTGDATTGDTVVQEVQNDTAGETIGDVSTDTDANASDPIALGKAALGKRAFKQAEEFFQTALDANPDSRQAKFGMFLSDFQRWTGLINAVLSSYAPTKDVFGQKQSGLVSQGKDLSALLTEYFTEFQGHESTAISLLKACLEDPKFQFSIDHFPIYIEGKTRIDLGGTYDKADLLWLTSMEYGLRAIMNFLLSNDWGKDGVRLFNTMQKGLGFKTFGSSFFVMMQQEPGFLARPKDSTAFQAFLNDLDSWAAYGLQAAGAIKAKDRPKDAIFVLLPENQGKTLVEIRGRYAGDEGALKFLLVGPKYGLIDSYNKVRAAVAGKALLPLKQGIGVPFVVGLDVVRQVIPLAGIVSLFKLPPEYSSMITAIQSKPADGTSFSDLLFGALPLFLFDLDAVALDLKAAADNNFALRDLFAAMPENTGVLPYEGEYMEYDCPRIALTERAFIFDQNLGVVVWDLSAKGTVSVTAKVYSGGDVKDTETFTLDPVSGIKGLFTGQLKTRLSDSPTTGNAILEGDETKNVVEITYDANGTPVTVSITDGKPESYAGEVAACQAKASGPVDHFDSDFYKKIVKNGLPYQPKKASDKAYRLWPGAAKKVIYVNPKVLKVDQTDKFVPADSYLLDVLAKHLI